MTLTERFEQALVYAARLHGAQVRKGSGVPYVSHLLAVAALVLEHGGNEDEAIAALLHDAIEDHGGGVRQQIRERFGEAVLQIVEGCTDSDTIPKPPWPERKRAFVERLRQAPAAVRLVSAADRLHNARSLLRDYHGIGEGLWERFRGGREGTLWYYRAVAEALGQAEVTPLVEELRRAVAELEQAAAAGSPPSGPAA